MNKVTHQIFFYLGIFLIWSLITRLKIWPEYIVPTPYGVGASMLDGIKDGSVMLATLASLKRIGTGYAISIFSGISLGILIGRNHFLNDTVGSMVTALQTLPSICWLPLSILWFGLNEKSIIFVVIMGALLAITTATVSGVKNIPPIYIKAGKNMGADGWTLFRTILIPAAMPAIVSGLKQGWSFAWRSLMAGELLYVSVGLGQLLMMGRELNDMNRVIAVMLVLIGVGLVIDRLIFANLENSIRRRWGFEG